MLPVQVQVSTQVPTQTQTRTPTRTRDQVQDHPQTRAKGLLTNNLARDLVVCFFTHNAVYSTRDIMLALGLLLSGNAAGLHVTSYGCLSSGGLGL